MTELIDASRDARIDGPIGDLYAAYDSDPRVSGPDDFAAFADAVEDALLATATRQNAPMPSDEELVYAFWRATDEGDIRDMSVAFEGIRAVRKAITAAQWPEVPAGWLSTTNNQLIDVIAGEVDPTYGEEGGRLARLRAHNIIVAIREFAIKIGGEGDV